MSPTASLRRWAQYIKTKCRMYLRRVLVYSLNALGKGTVYDSVLVKLKRKGAAPKRVWIVGGVEVKHARGFITVIDCFGNTSMFAEDTVHSVVSKDVPENNFDASGYKAKVSY